MCTRAPVPGSRASLIDHPTPANQARYGTGDPIKACSQRFHYTPASGNGRVLLSVGMARQRSNELDRYGPRRAMPSWPFDKLELALAEIGGRTDSCVAH